MHHLPKFFSPRNRDKKSFMDSSSKSSSRKPKLGRVNAAKNIDYEPSSSSSDVSSSSLHISSMEFTDRSSFRIEGLSGPDNLIRIYRSLELSGPDDFAISTADWEAWKSRPSLDLLPRPSIYSLESPKVEEVKEKDREFEDESFNSDMATINSDLTAVVSEIDEPCVDLGGSCGGGGGGRSGINGVRPPPVLKPPPSIRLPVVDHTRSTWDILKDFAPQEDEEEEGVKQDEEEGGNRIGESVESNWGSFTTSNDDDSSSSTTEPANISPNMRTRPIITSWNTGKLLGRGSFGSVYEGISGDGTFFAIKEVSLLNEDSQGRQSIHQLEQEIALLSAFQHENIVQYYGTHTDGSKLYIFLELVSQGSLMSLYQRIPLLDSHVSAYTRQILSGLKYLHERDVVHRDIKCANILVDVNGSVKLADFGLAKATKLNDVKSCKGTAFWMAPEVVNGKGQGYGLAADIWSLGCTVLEMLTHKLPYSEMENPMQALYRIGRGIPPAVPDALSKDAQDFILLCLKVNPYDRPSAADLLCHSFVKRPHSSLSGSMSPYRPVRSN